MVIRGSNCMICYLLGTPLRLDTGIFSTEDIEFAEHLCLVAPVTCPF